MKQHFIHFFFIVFLIMEIPLHTTATNKYIDFNFPQDVSKKALVDLDKALKSGNGQQTVDALIRYGIAQSGISQDNMPDIVNKIEKVIQKEKRPEYKALLNYLEALVYQGYRDRFASWRDRNNPVGEEPTDVSEWDQKQFNVKITQLLESSLSSPEALKRVAVTSLPDIIKCNDLGAAYCPTLYEFLLMKNLDIYQTINDSDMKCFKLKDMWVQGTEGNVPAHIYALSQTGKGNNLEEYEKYKDSEYSALLLNEIYFYDKKKGYQILNDYVARFPNSIFTSIIKNRITDMESKSVTVSYPTRRTSHDSIPITVNVKNTNSFKINVYSVPLELGEEYRFNVNGLKLIKQHPMTAQGTVPFTQDDVKSTLSPLPYGTYILRCDDLSKGTNSPRSNYDIYNYSILRVSDIAPMSIMRIDNKNHIAAVDVKTGKPLPGVSINYYNSTYNYQNRISGTIGTTDANGLVAVPDVIKNKEGNTVHFDNMNITASKGEDKYSERVQYNRMRVHEYSSYSSNVYTDLGVYRPGETVQWTVVAFHVDNNGRTPLSNETLSVLFFDSNYKPIDTVNVRTDAYGRINGSIVVPKDRMNGRFSMVVKVGEPRFDQVLGRHYFDVSEYKTPTFAVTFPDARRSYTAGQPVKVSGKVETYSGMPVANTTVRLSLIQKEWNWWWWRVGDNRGEHMMDTTVTTDAQGMFTFTYEPDLFEENTNQYYRWSRYNYQVVATATNDAGETHEESIRFIVGTRRGIELGSENDDIYLNNKPIKLPLIYNTTDEQNTSTWCTWEIWPLGADVPALTGNVNTDDPTLDLTSLPSGQYKLKLHILDAQEGEQDVDVERNIVIYRKTDKQAPVKDCPLWIAPQEKNVDKSNLGHINVGVSTPKAYIYYVASTATTVIAEGWLIYDKGMNDFTVRLPKQAGADVTVQFTSYYNGRLWQKTETLVNPYKAEAVKITATSFRDKLTPGDMEHWTFTLTDQNDKPHQAAMLLGMFDKAIASISPNDWHFNNWRRTGASAYIHANSLSGNGTTTIDWTGVMVDIPHDVLSPRLPVLYVYDQDFFGRMLSNVEVVAYGTARKSSLAARPAPMEEARIAMKSDNATADTEESESAIEEPQVNEQNLEKVQLRENDVKTALWEPMLTTDAKGKIKIDFEVPNFNTTWIAQAVAWDEKMVGSQWMAEVLTQKPLMVRSSMPRFLRQGDVATLAATVQNATDRVAACDAVIELFDPRSGDIYTTRKFNLQLDSMGSQAVTIDWTVPDTIAMVGFRIKAANGHYGDGEQVMVPVLTTISPVIETEPFYIEAAQSHFETLLPQFPADARVTLEYCDNPIWYCVLALPTIFSDNYQVATQAAHSLYALQVAQGVAKAQPQIKEAINYWKEHNEDSTFVSMLQKNRNLKIGTLLASPWMREADRQTLRMSRLSDLFDDATVKMEYEKIISALQSLQMPDGGFTWFRHPNCESNIWTTGVVLEILGEIKHMGFLPEDSRLTTMLNHALNYYDKKNVDHYKELVKQYKNPFDFFVGYAYTRTLYPEVKLPSASANLVKKTLNHMDKNWDKGITLRNKAFYALTLERNGYHKTAASIVESIRQFAITKPTTGMYWDNLQTDYGWWEHDKVAYTTVILRAMNEVDPRQDEIDQVRKWILLMKQSNDWGSYSLAADAVHSILSTGSQWLDRSTSNPVITIDGQPINLDKMAKWLGYFRTTLQASTSGSVIIDRTGSGPAWGAVYSQFKAPMTQIQEKSIEEVSISKDYYVYGQDGSLHSATSFKVGDKVKVRVIIKVNKDMDYVTITDERAACFEPVDQLSGYRSEDRTWFYQETKDTQTNVFISNLDKGTHVIGYDVWVTNPGEFTSGIATIQSQYAPQLSAHSAGKSITIKGE